MDALEAIASRRSIRKFRDDPISDETIERLLVAATQAPSGKNTQPWRFVVVRSDKRAEMVRLLREGIAKNRAQGRDTGSAVGTADVMAQAPVTVFAFNPAGKHPWEPRAVDEVIWDVVNLQSIGAAIENLCLAAQALGLGSLWICDVFSAYEELRAWLGQEGLMVAAVSLGYADEAPAPRPRKPASDTIVWF
jgi:F420 biosynthesis protein FbiB-like protein